MNTEKFDKMFDDGEDISDYIDWSTTRNINQQQKRVNVDLPVWMVNFLDREAKRIGVTRQSVIKFWIAERLDELRKTESEKSITPKEL